MRESGAVCVGGVVDLFLCKRITDSIIFVTEMVVKLLLLLSKKGCST
jgi:hypothetical protein